MRDRTVQHSPAQSSYILKSKPIKHVIMQSYLQLAQRSFFVRVYPFSALKCDFVRSLLSPIRIVT